MSGRSERSIEDCLGEILSPHNGEKAELYL